MPLRRSKGIPYASLPPHLQAQVRAQLSDQKVAGVLNDPLHRYGTPTPALDKMVRQQSGPVLNKTEARFLEWLQAKHKSAKIYSQAITFKLANGVRYTPDFVVMKQYWPDDDEDSRSNFFDLTAYETKGFMRDDASVKIKFFAKEYPEIPLTLARWDKDTYDWKFQEIYA